MQTKSEKIADKLKEGITSGKYTDKLPSEQEIAALYHSSCVTAGKALNLLQDVGIIKRVPRLGSFVNREKKQPIKIWLCLPEKIQAEISALLRDKFPQFTILFSSSDETNPLKGGYDIIRTAATFPFVLSEYFKPLPDEIVREFTQSGDYFSKLLDVSRDHRVYYSLPILFSPLVIACNRDIADKLGIKFSGNNFTFEEFAACAEKMETSPYDFCNSDILFWLRYSLFMDLKIESGLPLAEAKRILAQRLRRTAAIVKHVTPMLQHGFLHRKSLFMTICRQYFSIYKDEFNFSWSLLPPPELAGAQTVVTGEFLAVSNNSTRIEDAFKILRSFLDRDVQAVIAKYRYGIPVRKSLLYDTFDSRIYRDDVFVNEIRNMNCDNAADHELHVACEPLIQKFNEGKIGAEELCESAADIFLELIEAAGRRAAVETNYNFSSM